jgi:hypothetical protein
MEGCTGQEQEVKQGLHSFDYRRSYDLLRATPLPGKET